jgi:hypothetical protein
MHNFTRVRGPNFRTYEKEQTGPFYREFGADLPVIETNGERGVGRSVNTVPQTALAILPRHGIRTSVP